MPVRYNLNFNERFVSRLIQPTTQNGMLLLEDVSESCVEDAQEIMCNDGQPSSSNGGR